VGLAIPLSLLLGYLFYATPFLIVLRDDDLLPAPRRSYALATEGGPHLRFAADYCGLVVAGSLPATPVVATLGVVGVVLGAVAVAQLSLALAFATTRVVADVDPASRTFRGVGKGRRPGAAGRTTPGDRSPRSCGSGPTDTGRRRPSVDATPRLTRPSGSRADSTQPPLRTATRGRRRTAPA
jgi:hypothetical protein